MTSPDLTSDDIAIMREVGIELEPQAADEPGAQAAQPGTPTSAQPAADPAAPQTASTQQTGDQAAPAQPQPGGDVRAALRASRRAEQRAREEAARLKAENEALKEKVGATDPAAEPDPMSDEEIAKAERDFPLLGKIGRFVKQAMAAQPAQSQPTGQPEFVPQALPQEVQAIVDETPALLAWQLDPDQARFALAKSTDALLQQHPFWRDKPMADRFAEVVRRVSAELPQGTPAPATTVDPQAVFAAVPRRVPETLSHIGGGGGPQPQQSNLARFAQMSDDAILADLARG